MFRVEFFKHDEQMNWVSFFKEDNINPNHIIPDLEEHGFAGCNCGTIGLGYLIERSQNV